MSGLSKPLLYIDGAWREPRDSGTSDVINPATEEVVSTAAWGTRQDAEDAVAAARRAFDSGPWRTMDLRERSDLMFQLHAVLQRRVEEIAEIVTSETGAPVSQALPVHAQGPLHHFEWYCEMARRPMERSLPTTVTPQRDGTKLLGASVAIREPRGVVGAITAYNFPFYLNMAKIGPALATGNTLVLKPAPSTPLSAMVLAEAVHEVGFPEGVFNVVTGGHDVGEVVSSDHRVDMVTFTGSDAIGISVMKQAAETVKPVLLELGGKSPLIVRDDADMATAVAWAVGHTVTQAGQGCALHTRHLVHESIFDDYVDAVGKALAEVKIGDPTDPTTGIGPLSTSAQLAKVEAYVDEAVAQGARVVTGGKRPEHLDRGFFYEPTLLTEVQNSWRVCQDEIFGPVAVAMPFTDDDHAVDLANDSVFGLSGSVFSTDVGAAYEIARRIRTGQMHINGGTGTSSPWAAFGGYKRSGIGRELGEEVLQEYTEAKVIKFHGG